MQRRTALPMLLISALSFAGGSKKGAMKEFSIHFPVHLLRFSLPVEMVRWRPPAGVPDYFDPGEHEFTDGYEIIFRTMADFNGSFWVGALGSLFVNLTVVQRKAEFHRDIDSFEGLEDYLNWWIRDEQAIYKVSRIVVSGTPALLRSAGPWSQMITFALDQRRFLQFGLSIDHVGGKSTSWIRRAESMRDAIKASISFTAKYS